MVNKTGLPSFIVTLASFFTLRGVMLVISKRLVGKVQVDQITEQKGAKFFKDWIAHEWKFTEFGGRDKLFLGLVIAGGAAFIYGLLEQSFIRRVSLNWRRRRADRRRHHRRRRRLHRPAATPTASATTLSTASSLCVGADRWRSSGRRSPAGSAAPRPSARARCHAKPSVALRLGIGCIVLACLTPIPFDRHQRDAILTWTSPSLRPVIAIVAADLGIGAGDQRRCCRR